MIALTQARASMDFRSCRSECSAVAAVCTWLVTASPLVQRVGRFNGFIGGLFLILRNAIVNGGSIAARWTIWQASLRLLWRRLWTGYGADTLELYFPSVYPPQLVYYQGRGVIVDRAHNWLLDWSLNYGVVATVLLTVLIYSLFWQAWNQLVIRQNKAVAHASEEQHYKTSWLAACMASLCAYLIGNLFLFDVAATAVVFWLLLAIVTSESISLTVKIGSNIRSAPDSECCDLWHSCIRFNFGCLAEQSAPITR